ncbi:hypothetical protein Si102_01730 [Streptococcus infantarius subsp. infantarius]|nr:hypothetical protein [Streptococcus infantarius subsp. infantarius]MCO4506898.1 hypothetical protein [Streptococcus infantarius subsp. infantarius]MCO4518762.1 hypothetical protein [Streptococcus infantarius subsp. infantarius]MCO4519807.1 hypothetical protein [Streptococcus infantarius subsp. infantarius]MCO4524407.1 hypothetical protein [Streptococcus infantarius subsp. infantarius]
MLEKYDRTINIAGMPCLIRFIPSFVKRYKKWDTEIRHSSLCPFCDVGETSNKTQFSTFKYLENDFPFMLNQFTIFCAKHKEFLNCNELEYALDLINKSCVLKSGSLQIQGSGASIPEHAHFSVSSEVYPITMLKRKIFVESKNYNIEQILGIPHLAIVISGSISHISRITNKILSNIRRINLSYNLLMTDKGEIIIVPRTNEYSPTLDRKVGVSLVGGIYPCYLKNVAKTRNELDILLEMFKHWESVNSENLVTALNETTISSDLNYDAIKDLLKI